MEDITSGLLEKIQTDFQNEFDKNERILGVYQKVRDGTATYIEANDFAVETGKILANAYGNNLSSNVLPDGRMYYNIAQRIINPTMENNYKLITDITNKVQQLLNEMAKIGIKPVTPELNQDRVNGIVNRLASTKHFDDVSWILGEPIVNFSQSIVDDAIQGNAEFHAKAGMRPVIERKLAGGCCEWCARLKGTYTYPDDVPHDVFRRHQRCRCTVDYIPKHGKIQNVHSKQWKTQDEKSKLDERKKIGTEEVQKVSIQKGRDVTFEYERTKYPGQGKITVDDGYDKELHGEEVSVAQWLHKNLGGDIRLLNESVVDGVKMPDYLWNGKYWELKTTSTEKAANSAIRKAIKQIEDNPGGIILNYNSEINLQETINTIEKRMKGSKKGDIPVDIMIVQNEKMRIVLRY